jgi:hypothetical protein
LDDQRLSSLRRLSKITELAQMPGLIHIFYGKFYVLILPTNELHLGWVTSGMGYIWDGLHLGWVTSGMGYILGVFS